MKYEFNEFAYLYLNNELTVDEAIEFENLIAEDSNLNDEFNSIKEFNSKINKANRKPINEKLLTDARRNLRIEISNLVENSEKKDSFLDKLKSLFTKQYSPILTSAFSIVAGLLIGYFIFADKIEKPSDLKGFDLDEALSNNYKINNIQFTDDINNGENFTVQFEAAKPVVLNGNVNDPHIRKILVDAIMVSDNAGLKMRSINKLMQNSDSKNVIESSVKEALIKAVKLDPNPGVRKEALNALTELRYDNEIRDALLFVLANDKNSGLRIASINALVKIKPTEMELNAEIKNTLSNQIENEESEYIKLRTASLLGEVR